MLYHASKAGAFQLEAAVLEAVASMRRAGKCKSTSGVFIVYFMSLSL